MGYSNRRSRWGLLIMTEIMVMMMIVVWCCRWSSASRQSRWGYWNESTQSMRVDDNVNNGNDDDNVCRCLLMKVVMMLLIIIVSVFSRTKRSTIERAFNWYTICRVCIFNCYYCLKKYHHRKSFRLIYNLSCLYFYLNFLVIFLIINYCLLSSLLMLSTRIQLCRRCYY